VRRPLLSLASLLAACSGAPLEPPSPLAAAAPSTTASAAPPSPRRASAIPRLGANGIACLARENGTLVCWGTTPWGNFDEPHLITSAPRDRVDVDPSVHLLDQSGIVTVGADGSWARYLDGAWQELPSLQGLTRLGLGRVRRCGLRGDGDVVCWGSLSDPRALPVLGAPIVRGAVDLAVSDVELCALSAAGVVSCAGQSVFPGPRRAPGEVAEVSGLPPITRLAAGREGICALATDGKVLCWGRIGPERRSGAPFEVPGIEGATAIAAQLQTVCAVVAGGKVKCFTDQLGKHESSPAQLIEGMPPLVAIAAGCGTSAGGSLHCWGSRPRHRPALVPGLAEVQAISAGVSGTCALLASGEVSCWGSFERVPRGAREFGPTWAPVPIGVRDATAIAMSEGPGQRYDLCWIDRAAEVSCRGEPGTVKPGVRGATALSVGANHACALRLDGEVWCWGGSDAPAFPGGADRAKKVTGLPAVASLDAGRFSTCAVDRAGEVWCWGPPPHEDARVPAELSLVPRSMGIRDADAVSVTGGYACARLRGGTVTCFGKNRFSLLAPDPEDQRPLLGAHDLGLTHVKQIRAAANLACDVGDDGRVSCWGFPFAVTLGGRPSTRTVPRGAIEGLTDVVDLALGEGHACALRRDRRVLCWGGLGGNVDNGTPTSGVRLALPGETR
jgi:alpha-tubulin suppressor-like RCC1 family protein